ncbi:MAG: GTP cyclohydrolase II [Deltaproteobacteria bacterium]|nr:GTP cyclohydrolase II [Deltaproteobacteria bacterium]
MTTLAGAVLRVDSRPLSTRHGDVTAHVCRDLARRTYFLAFACGDLSTPEPLLARVHSSCLTSETLGGCDCDCAEQLDAALAAIAAAGRGVVFYLDQEGRGAGFGAKVRDRMLVQASGGRLGTFDAYARMGLPGDLRAYDAVAAARRALDIAAPLRVLTNNPEKLAALAALGVPLAGAAPLALPPSPFNRHYLAAKAAAGHRLAVARADEEAAPPAPIEVVAPYALPEAPTLIGLGSYWLPVRRWAEPAAPPAWCRLHAYVEAARGRERVVLIYGDAETKPVLLRVQRESLLERVRGSAPGLEQARWLATLRAFAAHGAGVAIVEPDERGDSLVPTAPRAEDAAANAALARRHLGGRAAVPLVADAERRADAWPAALAASGVALDPPRALAAA